MADNDGIDFLSPTHSSETTSSQREASLAKPVTPQQKPGSRLSPAVKLAVFGVAILFVGGFLLSTGVAQNVPNDNSDNLSFFNSLRRLITPDVLLTSNPEDDRINLLLLGIGGAGHDGPELTDTIIFGSFRPSTKEVGLISIPRDLTVEIEGYGYRKINHVNALAELEKRGSGQEASAHTIGTILGQEVHHTVKVDFNGFEEIIDALGGVDVYVERSFTDLSYPLDDGLGTVTSLYFIAGWQHLDGATALAYARSRHGTNGEGSDFARAARQQKILLAVKDKALSLGVLLNPTKLNRIAGVIRDNVKTDLSVWDMIKLAKYIPDIEADKITNHVLDTQSGLLYETSINGAYVILPYKEDWSELHELATNIFTPQEDGFVFTNSPIPEPQSPAVIVEIQNGTMVTGLAGQTALILESSGYTVQTVDNATERNWTQTTIYDFTDGEKDEELAALKEYLNASVVMSTEGFIKATAVVPESIVQAGTGYDLVTSEEDVDFLIILGQDAANLVLGNV